MLSSHLAQPGAEAPNLRFLRTPPPQHTHFSFPKLHPIGKPSGHLTHTYRASYTSTPRLLFLALANFVPSLGDWNSILIGSLLPLPLPLLAVHSFLASRLIYSVHESDSVRGFPMTSISPEEKESSPQQRWTDIRHLLTAAALASMLLSPFVRFALFTAPPALPHQPLTLSLSLCTLLPLETVWNISQIYIAVSLTFLYSSFKITSSGAPASPSG